MKDRKSYNLRNERLEDLVTNVLVAEAGLVFFIVLIVSVIGILRGGMSLAKNLIALGLCFAIPALILCALVIFEIIIHHLMVVKRDSSGLNRPSEMFYPMIAQLLILSGGIAFFVGIAFYFQAKGLENILLKIWILLMLVVIIYHLILAFCMPIGIKRKIEKSNIEKLTLFISEDGHTPIRSNLKKMGQKGKILFVSFWEYKRLYKLYEKTPCNELWIEGTHDDYEGIVLDVMDECFERKMGVFLVSMADGKLENKKQVKMIADRQKYYRTVVNEQDAIDYFGRMSLKREWDWSGTPLAEEMKYRYVSETLVRMKSSNEESVTFYQLIKLVEYTYHYMALYEMATNENVRRKLSDGTFSSSMGLWKSIMMGKHARKEKIKKDSEEDRKLLIDAYRTVYMAVKGEATGVCSVTYDDIASRFVELRNNYIGHGTMAFSVSEGLINSMIILAGELIARFYKTDLILQEEDMFGDDIPYIYKKYDDYGKVIYYGLLAGVTDNEGTAEYLDYRSGCYYSNKEVTYTLDYEGEPVA